MPAPGASAPSRARWILPILLTVASVVALVVFLAPYRESMRIALDRASLWSLAGLSALALAGLALRTESWRIALSAAGQRPPVRELHAANAATFVVSLVNHYVAPAAKMVVLRRLGGPASARVVQLVAVDVASTVLEVGAVAVLLVFAATRLALPAWVPVLVVAAVVVAVVAARVLRHRVPAHPAIEGLAVLLRRGYAARVLGALVGVFALQIVRTWLALRVVGLDVDASDATLVFVLSGVLGALPSGIAAAPTTASLLVVGSLGTGAAAGAGILLTVTLAIGTLVYAVGCGLLLLRRRRAPVGATAPRRT